MSGKRTYLCECSNFSFIAEDTVSLEFSWPGPIPKSGQFFLIKPRRTGVFLGRPISVAGFKPRKQGARGKLAVSPDSGGHLRFLVLRRGRGSRDITDMRPGEEAELLGPLGNFWPLDDIPADNYRGKSSGPVALVGGGIGIAPLLAIIPELGKKTYDFYAGFRTGSFGLENINPRTLIIATEDGSHGLKGRIPDFFTPKAYCRVFACGPEPMLKIIGDACIADGVPCYLSIEKYMACGVGACKGCTVKTILGNRNCCTDGPIFKAGEICFEG
jgi:NAD(P)H-flavin reductase